MTMADIWLTPAAREEFDHLQESAPDQAVAVSDAIDEIPAGADRRIDLPGAPVEAPFLVKESRHRNAPVVIYRRTTGDERGKWLVVSLMNRGDYHAALKAEQTLDAAPPAVRNFFNAVVSGTVATIDVTAPPGTVTTTPRADGAAPTTGTDQS
jgi:hypothetical protein